MNWNLSQTDNRFRDSLFKILKPIVYLQSVIGFFDDFT
jgi:hypothetical protein